MDRVAYIRTGDGITLFLDGVSHSISSSHINYDRIKESLRDYYAGDENKADELKSLCDVPKAVTQFSKGRVTVQNGEVYYEGKVIHNSLTDRILDAMNEGFPCDPLLRFFENLMENPSRTAVEELYDWLAHKNLPITSEGMVMGYKAVRSDFKDFHTGTIDNSPGVTPPPMPRNQVSDNRDVACSTGYHLGTLEFASTFGDDSRRIVICEFHPKDAVSVPKDSGCQKLRVCEYRVVGEYTGPLTRPIYNPDATPYQPEVKQDYHGGEIDEDEYFEDVDDDDICDSCGDSIDDCECDENDY